MYKYTTTVYLCKTEPLRMRYLGRTPYLNENTRFLIHCLYYTEYQSDTPVYSPIITITKVLRKQLEKRYIIYNYLQIESRNIYKYYFSPNLRGLSSISNLHSSFFTHNSFVFKAFSGVLQSLTYKHFEEIVTKRMIQ